MTETNSPVQRSYVLKSGPKFNWDLQTINHPFFKDLTEKETNVFLINFSDDEIQHMDLPAGLSHDEKVKRLLTILDERLAECEAAAAPKKYHKVNDHAWRNLMHGRFQMQTSLGLLEDSEQTLMQRMNTPFPDGRQDLSLIQAFALLRVNQGRYKEGEELARQTLDVFSKHPMLGPDSPQAFGTRRLIMEAIWKQEKYDEAWEFEAETKKMMETIKDGKFAKYADEEPVIWASWMDKLEKWKAEKESNSSQ